MMDDDDRDRSGDHDSQQQQQQTLSRQHNSSNGSSSALTASPRDGIGGTKQQCEFQSLVTRANERCGVVWGPLIGYASGRDIALVSTTEQKVCQTLSGHSAKITKLSWEERSQPVDDAHPLLLASGDDSGYVRLWNVQTGECRFCAKPPQLTEAASLSRRLLSSLPLGMMGSGKDSSSAYLSTTSSKTPGASNGHHATSSSNGTTNGTSSTASSQATSTGSNGVVDIAWVPSQVTGVPSVLLVLYRSSKVVAMDTSSGDTLWEKALGTAAAPLGLSVSPFRAATTSIIFATSVGFAVAAHDSWLQCPEDSAFTHLKCVADGGVIGVFFSPHFTSQIVVVYDSHITVIDAQTHRTLNRIMDAEKGGLGKIKSVCACRHVPLLACVHTSGIVSILASKNAQQAQYQQIGVSESLRLNSAKICGASFSFSRIDQLCTVTTDGSCFVYQLPASLFAQGPTGATSLPSSITYPSLKAKFLLDLDVNLTALEQPNCSATSPMNAMGESDLLVLGSKQGNIQVVDARQKVLLRQFSISTSPVVAVSFLGKSSILAVASAETGRNQYKNTIVCISLLSGRVVKLRDKHQPYKVTAVLSSPLGNYFLVAHSSYPVQVYAAAENGRFRQISTLTASKFPLPASLCWCTSVSSIKHWMRASASSASSAQTSRPAASKSVEDKRVPPPQPDRGENTGKEDTIKLDQGKQKSSSFSLSSSSLSSPEFPDEEDAPKTPTPAVQEQGEAPPTSAVSLPSENAQFALLSRDGTVYFFRVEKGLVTPFGQTLRLEAKHAREIRSFSAIAWKGNVMVVGDDAGCVHATQLKSGSRHLVDLECGSIHRLVASPSVTEIKFLAFGQNGAVCVGPNLRPTHHSTSLSIASVNGGWVSASQPFLIRKSGNITFTNAKLALGNSPLCASAMLRPSHSEETRAVATVAAEASSIHAPSPPSALSTRKDSIPQHHIDHAVRVGDHWRRQFWSVVERTHSLAVSAPSHRDEQHSSQHSNTDESEGQQRLGDPEHADKRNGVKADPLAPENLNLEGDFGLDFGLFRSGAEISRELLNWTKIRCDLDASKQLSRAMRQELVSTFITLGYPSKAIALLLDHMHASVQATRASAERATAPVATADGVGSERLADGDKASLLFTDAVRASFIASITASQQQRQHFQEAVHTVKVAAMGLISNHLVKEGVDLLVTAGDTLDACKYLQQYGYWSESIQLAKINLAPEDATAVVLQYADALFAQRRLCEACIHYASCRAPAKVLECLAEMQEGETARHYRSFIAANGGDIVIDMNKNEEEDPERS